MAARLDHKCLQNQNIIQVKYKDRKPPALPLPSPTLPSSSCQPFAISAISLQQLFLTLIPIPKSSTIQLQRDQLNPPVIGFLEVGFHPPILSWLLLLKLLTDLKPYWKCFV